MLRFVDLSYDYWTMASCGTPICAFLWTSDDCFAVNEDGQHTYNSMEEILENGIHGKRMAGLVPEGFFERTLTDAQESLDVYIGHLNSGQAAEVLELVERLMGREIVNFMPELTSRLKDVTSTVQTFTTTVETEPDDVQKLVAEYLESDKPSGAAADAFKKVYLKCTPRDELLLQEAPGALSEYMVSSGISAMKAVLNMPRNLDIKPGHRCT